MHNIKKTLYITLLCISTGGIIYFSSRINAEICGRNQGLAFYEELPATAPPIPTPIEARMSASNTPLSEKTRNHYSHIENKNYKKNEEPPWVPLIDFDALCTTASDTVGWIQLPETLIDYPVVQGKDNKYYLNRLPNGVDNNMGSIFLDYRNAPDFSDTLSVIYGHYLKSGKMFSILHGYSRQSFYDEHPHAFIFTPDENFKIEFIAGYILDASLEVLPMAFWDENDFEEYVLNIKNRSLFQSPATAYPGDRLIVLVTCDYYSTPHSKNSRLVIVGKLRSI